MTQQLTPHWQPIAQLPLSASLIDGMLESAEQQHQTLLEAQPRPYVLDDYTVGRVRAAFMAQRDDLWLFEEQLRRWDTEALTPAQRRKVDRLANQLIRLQKAIAAILALADELAGGTIERTLAADNVALGLEFLHGKHARGGS